MAISAPHFLEISRRRNARRCRHIIVKYIFKLNLGIWKFEDISSCRPIAKSHYLKLKGISYSLNLTISYILEICIFFQIRFIWHLELFKKTLEYYLTFGNKLRIMSLDFFSPQFLHWLVIWPWANDLSTFYKFSLIWCSLAAVCSFIYLANLYIVSLRITSERKWKGKQCLMPLVTKLHQTPSTIIFKMLL